MKIFIKYKQGGYNRDLRFLDTDLMYYFNGNKYKSLSNWLEIFKCMRENYPILVVKKHAGHFLSDETVYETIQFVINPSSIAMVFPMEEEEKEKKDFWLCDRCGAQLPDCTCPPSSDYIGSTNRDGITS